MLILALSEHPRLIENIEFQLLGAFVVFLALGLLWILLEISGMIFRRIDSPPSPRETSPQPTNHTSPVVGPSDIPSEIIAVIAAAVHVSLQTPFRIVSIEPRNSQDSHYQLSLQAWSVEGRRQIFESKRLR